MKLALVTGGLGFLGRHIVRRLVREGYFVRVLDPGVSRQSLGELDGQVEMICGTACDSEILKRCTDGARVLFHFAGATLPAESNRDPAKDAASNLIANLEVLNAAANSGVERVIFPSSGGTVYGIPTVVPISEACSTDPISSYGIVKLTTEKYMMLFERQYSMRCIALRYGNPYGDGQYASIGFGVIPAFFHAAAMNRPLEVWGDGSVVRDFIYIEDAVEATLRALHYTGPLGIFNIGSGVGTSINEIVRAIQEVTGLRIQVAYREGRQSDAPQIILDITRARQELGWSPRTSLNEGIARAWKWWLQEVESPLCQEPLAVANSFELDGHEEA